MKSKYFIVFLMLMVFVFLLLEYSSVFGVKSWQNLIFPMSDDYIDTVGNRSGERGIQQTVGVEQQNFLLEAKHKEMKMRLSRLQKVCHTLETSGGYEIPLTRSVTLVDSGTSSGSVRLVLCKVKKAASTELGRVVLLLNRLQQGSNQTVDSTVLKQHVQEIGSLKGSLIHAKLKSRIKAYSVFARDEDVGSVKKTSPLEHLDNVLVTRDPYARLFSGYLDKVYLMKFPGIVTSVFKRRYYREAGVSKTILARDITEVTFQQFLDYIVEMGRSKKPFDGHFYPVFYSCAPCQISYKYIVATETLSEDLQYVLGTMNASDSIKTAVKSLLAVDLVQNRIRSTVQTSFLPSSVEAVGYTQMAARVWFVLQTQGFLRDTEDFPVGDFNGLTNTDDIAAIFIQKNIEQNITMEESQEIRMNALRRAYKNITNETITEIQKIYAVDFMASGYDTAVP